MNTHQAAELSARRKLFGIVVLAALVLSGCISTNSYVDPSYGETSYEDLRRPAEPLALKINVEFSRNGARLPAADDEVRGKVERVVRASGLITPSDSATAASSVTTRPNAVNIGRKSKWSGQGRP